MPEDEIIELMLQVDTLKQAMLEIFWYNVRAEHGYVDEWTEAAAFTNSVGIAGKALSDCGFEPNGEPKVQVKN